MRFALSLLLVSLPIVFGVDVVHWTIGSILLPDGKTHFRLDLYSPAAPGSYPILVFLTGLSGFITASDYNTMLRTVSSQNVIIVGISKIENIEPEKMAVHISDFLKWLLEPNEGIARIFTEHRPVRGVVPDTDRLGFLSHSSAGHPITQYLNGTCGPLKLLVMMNPVDGLDPFGIFSDFITHPPTPLPFQIPTLIISAGLDSVPVRKGFPACAANNMSNDRFYRSLYGPTFLVNFTDYGHGDNIDEPIYEGVKVVCGGCTGTICDFPQYKLEEASLIADFVFAIYNRDVQLLQRIESPQSYLKTRVENKYDLHNYDYSRGGPGGFCKHD